MITGLATNVNVLTKIFTENQTKKVNVGEDVQSMPNFNYQNQEGQYQEYPQMEYEEVIYVNNS